MSFVHINPQQVTSVATDLQQIATALGKGIAAVNSVRDTITANVTGTDRAQRMHTALTDWTEVAPSIQQAVQQTSDYLNEVATTYTRLGQ